jgi:hypothetical protein
LQVFKTFPKILWNSKVSLSCSQETSTSPCPEPDQSSPC